MFTNDYDIVSELYDTYNQADYDFKFYLDRYKNHEGSIIELMSGTGRLSIPLLKEGLKLDCLDISKGLLEKLKEKVDKENLTTNIFKEDIRFMSLKSKYDSIIIGFNSFGEIIDLEDQKMVFKSIFNNLTEKGEFIFSLHNPNLRRKAINNNLTLINEYNLTDSKMLFFVSSRETTNAIVEIKQFYEFYRDGNMINKKLLELKFKLISKNEIEALIKETGFSIKEFYGDYNKSEFKESESPYMIYVLER